MLVLTKYNPVKRMFRYLAMSETQCIIYRQDFHNLQAKSKKLKRYLIVETEISIKFKQKISSNMAIAKEF